MAPSIPPQGQESTQARSQKPSGARSPVPHGEDEVQGVSSLGHGSGSKSKYDERLEKIPSGLQTKPLPQSVMRLKKNPNGPASSKHDNIKTSHGKRDQQHPREITKDTHDKKRAHKDSSDDNAGSREGAVKKSKKAPQVAKSTTTSNTPVSYEEFVSGVKKATNRSEAIFLNEDSAEHALLMQQSKSLDQFKACRDLVKAKYNGTAAPRDAGRQYHIAKDDSNRPNAISTPRQTKKGHKNARAFRIVSPEYPIEKLRNITAKANVAGTTSSTFRNDDNDESNLDPDVLEEINKRHMASMKQALEAKRAAWAASQAGTTTHAAGTPNAVDKPRKKKTPAIVVNDATPSPEPAGISPRYLYTDPMKQTSVDVIHWGAATGGILRSDSSLEPGNVTSQTFMAGLPFGGMIEMAHIYPTRAEMAAQQEARQKSRKRNE